MANPPKLRSSAALLLAIDTSTRAVGLAIYNGSQVLHEAIWTSHDHHTVELAPAIALALEKCGASMLDLQALAVATGPGSFTGLRIGMALAKGIALVRKIPLVGIPTLDALAAAQPVLEIPMVAVLRAGRGRWAASWYQAESGSWQASHNIQVLTPQDLTQQLQTPTYVCGELTEEERKLLSSGSKERSGKNKNVILASPAKSLRRPSFLAELAWQRWQAGKIDDAATLAPTYIHYSDPVPG